MENSTNVLTITDIESMDEGTAYMCAVQEYYKSEAANL
nr:MAG TPA: hypothetical protein [Caudoviricetes sp.]